MGTAATAAKAREVRLSRLAAQRAASLASPATATERIEIRPQPGPQERALACPADILLYGGAAGGGKTWALLLEAARNTTNKDFGAVLFRRIYPNITNEGGMWDESKKLYPLLGAKPDNGDLKWTFGSGARVKFSHLQYAGDVLNWKGAQVPLFGFDQLEEFEEQQFWYILSRNRSTCGVLPYIRATVNPVPADDKVGGWVHRLIQWWLDDATGLAIPERDGVIRWFIRVHDQLEWFDSRQAAVERSIQIGFPADKAQLMPKSLTFIAARLEDNKKLLEADPGYYANLMALPLVERERLHGANWNVRPAAGKIFNRAWFDLVAAAPADTIWIRYWDKAGTEDGGAYTAGVRIGHSASTKRFYIGDVQRGQWAEFERERRIKQTAELDGTNVTIWVEQEPGSGGKESARHTILNLAGWACYADRVTGDKYTRAQPFAAMVQALNVSLVKGEWNEAYLAELHGYTPDGSGYKDQVDGSSGAFNKLTAGAPLDLLESKPTEAQIQAQREQIADEFRQRVMRQGCVFPGE